MTRARLRLSIGLALGWVATLVTPPSLAGDDPPPSTSPAPTSATFVGPPRVTPADPVHEAFQKLEQAGDDWRAALAATKALGDLGDKALHTVLANCDDHEDVRVRRACVTLLYTVFPKDPRARAALIRTGLRDKDARIRYECTFYVGALKFHEAHRPLRKILESTGKDDDRLRMTAAKSLAELGEPDVIRILYEGATADSYMLRHMANLGLKALSGKTLDDFRGYKYGEGAFVSGGNEYMTLFDALSISRRKADRFAAMTAYLEWLQKERPDLYKHLAPSY